MSEKFKNGLSTNLGENGVKLSGGERQRIAIARALFKDSDIILFDEATSQLDSETENVIQNAIKILKKSKTVISVAHRLTSVRRADEIFVIDEGKIVEKGNHEDLVEKKGVYSYFLSCQDFRSL